MKNYHHISKWKTSDLIIIKHISEVLPVMTVKIFNKKPLHSFCKFNFSAQIFYTLQFEINLRRIFFVFEGWNFFQCDENFFSERRLFIGEVIFVIFFSKGRELLFQKIWQKEYIVEVHFIFRLMSNNASRLTFIQKFINFCYKKYNFYVLRLFIIQ